MTMFVEERLSAAVESLLFAAPEPLTAERIARIVDVPQAEVEAVLSHLTNGAYKDRGIHVVRVAGGYQMRTHPDFALFVGRLLASPPTRLSRAALETLAIVAYRQPVTLPEIEAIRGVDASGVVKTLTERGLIEEVGRKDTVGRPVLYATTSSFLQHFGLNTLEDLPELPKAPEDDIGEPGA